MDQIRRRKFGALEYGDPRGFLAELRKAEAMLSGQRPDRARRLRTNVLKPARELRDAALFCVGIGERLGLQVGLAPVEDEDFDFVATCSTDQTQHYCPVQLKEVAPGDLNPSSSINDAMKSLPKYGRARDLTIAIRLNRTTSFDPASIVAPGNLSIGGLWVFGCVSDDQSSWAIWGDFMKVASVPFGTVFEYPV